MRLSPMVAETPANNSRSWATMAGSMVASAGTARFHGGRESFTFANMSRLAV